MTKKEYVKNQKLLKKKYWATGIKNKRIDNLSISWDFYDREDRKFPVFLFTPDMKATKDHYHIKLDLRQVKKLHNWLGRFIKEKKNGR